MQPTEAQRQHVLTIIEAGRLGCTGSRVSAGSARLREVVSFPAMADVCTHLETIHHREGGEGVAGCPECLAVGASWVHLRRCTECGRVGCCDSSPNRHATRHHEATGHPVIRSLEPGEHWFWCYEDEVAFELS